MKIGLISINANTKVLNHACPLHTYAFQQFLLDNGIESVIINYKPNYYGKYNVKYPLYHHQKYPNKDPEKQAALLKKWEDLFDQRAERFDKFENFLNKYYIQTDKTYTVEDLDKIDLGFDCYICVTDVIWKNLKKSGLERGFLLGAKTMAGKKKIAYAASRGPSTYPRDKELEFLGYLKDFNYISVRETSFQSYIKEAAGIDVPHVIDPVFLKERAFYENLAITPKKKKGYVLLYIVMEKNTTIVKQAVEFAQKHDLDIYELSEDLHHATIPKGTYHDVIYNIGVEEWLGYMLEAEYIFTNSFHACCFSAIFEKQFFAGMRHGDKIDSLLEILGLTWRRIGRDIKGSELVMEDINFEDVRPLIEKNVASSKEYILKAIKSVEQDNPPTFRKQIDKYMETSQYRKHLIKVDEEFGSGKKPSLFRRAIRKIRKTIGI